MTFSTTTHALEAERLCKENKLPGRLIPVPTKISAGCGMALSISPEYSEAVKQLFEKEKLAVEGIYELEL